MFVYNIYYFYYLKCNRYYEFVNIFILSLYFTSYEKFKFSYLDRITNRWYNKINYKEMRMNECDEKTVK